MEKPGWIGQNVLAGTQLWRLSGKRIHHKTSRSVSFTNYLLNVKALHISCNSCFVSIMKEKFPFFRVLHLILADPWGFPERPAEIQTRFPWYVRGLFHIFKHFNPLALFRMAGPYAENSIRRMRPDLIRKFEPLFPTEEENMSVIPNYLFHCNSQSPR